MFDGMMKQEESEVKRIAMSAARQVDKERSDYIKNRLAQKIEAILDREAQLGKISGEIREIKSEIATYEMMDVPEAYENLRGNSNGWYLGASSIIRSTGSSTTPNGVNFTFN